MIIAWDKSNEIGIKTIDQQHQYFLAIINKIFALNEKKVTAKEDLAILVYQLAGYAMFHFAAEEKLCAKYGYPGTKRQKKFHQLYQEEISNFMYKMQNPRTNIDRLTEDIATFSVNWLTQHILVEDKKFGDWYKKHRRKSPLLRSTP